MFKTEEEKTVKLITLLRQRSRDTLSGEQLNQLALAVKTGRQYTVRIHTTPSGFLRVACACEIGYRQRRRHGRIRSGAFFGAATESGYREGRLFLPSRQACAVVSRKRADGSRISFSNEIHIYIPSSIYEKGKYPKYGQKQKATYSV